MDAAFNLSEDSDEGGPLLGTDPALFVADADPATTTDPTAEDTDGDGVFDGAEDLNANGQVDPGETDPNDELSFPPVIAQVPALPTALSIVLALLLLWSGSYMCARSRGG